MLNLLTINCLSHLSRASWPWDVAAALSIDLWGPGRMTRCQSSCQQLLPWSMPIRNRGLQLSVHTALPRSDWLVAGLEMSTESQLKCERMDCFLTAARRFYNHPQCRLFKQQRGKEGKRIACDQRCSVPCRVTFNFWFPHWCFWNTEQWLCGELCTPGPSPSSRQAWSLGLWSSHLPVLCVIVGKIKCPDRLVPSRKPPRPPRSLHQQTTG